MKKNNLANKNYSSLTFKWDQFFLLLSGISLVEDKVSNNTCRYFYAIEWTIVLWIISQQLILLCSCSCSLLMLIAMLLIMPMHMLKLIAMLFIMLTAISASVSVFSLLWLGVGEAPPPRRDPTPPFCGISHFYFYGLFINSTLPAEIQHNFCFDFLQNILSFCMVSLISVGLPNPTDKTHSIIVITRFTHVEAQTFVNPVNRHISRGHCPWRPPILVHLIWLYQ